LAALVSPPTVCRLWTVTLDAVHVVQIGDDHTALPSELLLAQTPDELHLPG
jgi:hypothetical protein